jgi:acyl-coenzyme A synthetase/AMP-(fatty) acid ligase/aryl carrier-like protein
MRPDLVAVWLEWVGDLVELLNFYGPTETSVATTWAKVAGPAQKWRERREVPIGRPLPNVRVYILDDWMKPVPVGVIGKLYVGGIGVGRGYWQRAELTQQAFMEDPFYAGGRIYNTGDLARWLPDGQLEFAGRADLQVKVRGFRLELGEVESTIRAYPGVKDCAAFLRERSSGEGQMVACLAFDEPHNFQIEDIKTFLKGKLPEYMVPVGFLCLQELPLTSGGKIDRNALRMLDFETGEQVIIEPRTEIEAELSNIWQEVLGLRRLSVQDNFFDLGGHSLMAMQIVARIRKVFNVELSLRMLFESPTIAGMAEWVALLRDTEDDSGKQLDPGREKPDE